MLPRRRGKNKDETPEISEQRPDGICNNGCIRGFSSSDRKICAAQGVDILGGEVP